MDLTCQHEELRAALDTAPKADAREVSEVTLSAAAGADVRVVIGGRAPVALSARVTLGGTVRVDSYLLDRALDKLAPGRRRSDAAFVGAPGRRRPRERAQRRNPPARALAEGDAEHREARAGVPPCPLPPRGDGALDARPGRPRRSLHPPRQRRRRPDHTRSRSARAAGQPVESQRRLVHGCDRRCRNRRVRDAPVRSLVIGRSLQPNI